MVHDTRLLRLHASPQPDLLVCIPHAGAGVSAFLGWPRRLNHLLSLALVQLPGREDRMHEVLSQTLPEISTRIADELARINAGTRFIFGHSMGASIAWAVAGQLWRRHGIKPIVILSAQSPSISLREPNANPANLREWFRVLGEDFPQALENTELLELFQKTFSADCAWMHRELMAPPDGRLPVDLHGIYAMQDGLISREKVAQWQNYTSADFTITSMQGGHLYFQHDPDALLTYISHLIEVYRHHADSACIT